MSQAQAQLLIGELERVADTLVDRLDAVAGGDKALRAARRELYEVRKHIRRLQTRYGLTHPVAQRNTQGTPPLMNG